MAPKLERYEILGELGHGGMSVVYRARDRQLGREVAVKVLHDFLARQEDSKKRFHREAVAVAKLHHRGILEIFDYSGPEAKESFIVTELIEGQTLRAFIEDRGVLPLAELAALIMLELVAALRHAHTHGVVHRDLKPENVMIARDGQLKLMDFGIAQIMGGATKLTATGTLLGSPAHMAPEVIDGQPADHRADIFSLGTILYWLATGSLPFGAPNPSALFRQILEGRYPAPQEIAPRIGNGLARIIERALATQPEDRYQDISELESELSLELQSVELQPPDSLIRNYLLDPKGFVQQWRPRLIATLARTGIEALNAKNLARAMDRFNRVLALEPDHPEVRAQVARIARLRAMRRNAGRAALTLTGAATVFGLGWGGMVLSQPGEPPATVNVAPPPTPKIVAVTTPQILVDPPWTSPALPAGLQAVEKKVEKERPERPKVEAEVAPVAPEPVEEPAVVTAKLTVRIGGSWAYVRINDGPEARVFKPLQVELRAGRHQVEVTHPTGRYVPRTIEVDAQGGLFEVFEGGQRQVLRDGVLLFRIPRPDEAPPTGWNPA